MIHVDRVYSERVIAALTRRGRDMLTERERAEGHYLRGVPERKPTFSAYNSDEVKDALNEMFSKKCAYCESRYAHVAPMDVEHFRPKNAYLDHDGTLVRPGYYWLAADWDNLLPSCIDCNRERKHFRRASDGRLLKSKSGKANKFPLAPGSPRAAAPNEDLQEVPLLLNPCADNPADHLRFTVDGMVLPSVSPIEDQLPKGETTIEVCGLCREDLVRERKGIGIRLQDAMERICQILHTIRRYPHDPNLIHDLERAEESLARFQLPGEPYAAMVKELVETFKAVRDAAEMYIKSASAWKANPGNAELERKVRLQMRALKDVLNENSHADLTRSILVWLKADAFIPNDIP
jgi:uncharacterized protein (TIGR02646 family)